MSRPPTVAVDHEGRSWASRLHAWRHSHLGSVFLTIDFLPSVPLSISAAFLVYRYEEVAKSADAILLAYAGALVALTAFVVTAHTLVISLISKEYLEILERAKGGVSGVSRPYKIVTWVCAVGALVAFLATLAWNISSDYFESAMPLVFAVPTFMVSWGILGAAHLIGLGAFHLESRAALLTVIRDQRARHNEQARPNEFPD